MAICWKSLRRKYPDILTYRSVSRKIRKNLKKKYQKIEVPSAKSGAYIYADESGNSGRDIFSEHSPFYFQGAILSVGEVDGAVTPIIQKYCKKYNLERLHGYELGEGIVNEVCLELLTALGELTWRFHYTKIKKKYVAPTKFVETILNSNDNPAVHPLWYTTELFRHILCILIDEMMEGGLDEKFWGYYLADDIDGLIEICKALLEKTPYIIDKRASEVITDGLDYVIKNPDIITLTSSKGKSAYKKQTPNIIAFSSLIYAVNRFCKKYDVSLSELIHDQSDEFKGTMREYYRDYIGFDFEEDKFGGIPKIKEVEYGLGTFKLESSKLSYGLQVSDLFLWVVQREVTDKGLKLTKSRILENSDDFVISRQRSLDIVEARYCQVMQKEITPEEMEAGKEMNKKILSHQFNKMKSRTEQKK